MVSLNTIFTLGVIGAAALAFTSLGGAGGIGSRIGGSFGGGIRSFNENITSSFNAALQGLNPFAAAQESTGEKINLQLSSDPSMYTDPTTVTLPEEYKPNRNGGAVDTSPLPAAIPAQTTRTPEVISGKSYLEKTLQYVQQPLTVISQPQAAINVISRAKSDYGGYGSASSQNRELQSLLATNAQKYGSYFN
jgi:hypothetical protein